MHIRMQNVRLTPVVHVNVAHSYTYRMSISSRIDSKLTLVHSMYDTFSIVCNGDLNYGFSSWYFFEISNNGTFQQRFWSGHAVKVPCIWIKTYHTRMFGSSIYIVIIVIIASGCTERKFNSAGTFAYYWTNAAVWKHVECGVYVLCGDAVCRHVHNQESLVIYALFNPPGSSKICKSKNQMEGFIHIYCKYWLLLYIASATLTHNVHNHTQSACSSSPGFVRH